MKLLLIIILFIIIIILTIIYKNDNLIIKNDNNINNELFIKYSSIKNKLITSNDYINFYSYLETIKTSIYFTIIDTHIINENKIIELISNDIAKTKQQFNFNKLKNIYVIIKQKDNYNKIIIFYDGLIYNTNKFYFVENDFNGNTIVYKLDLNNKIINHLLQ